MKVTRVFVLLLLASLASTTVVAQTEQNISVVPTVAYCDLVKEPASYDQKIVRVRAVYFGAFESSLFYDNACRRKDTWVQFDPSYEKTTKPEILERYYRLVDASIVQNSDGSRYSIWRVEILAVGRFEGVKRRHEFQSKGYSSGFGHLDAYDFQFTVLSIEHAKAVSKKASK